MAAPASNFVAFASGVRYERLDHGFEIGDSVTAIVDGRRIYGRVVGFDSYEGSGLCFVNSMLQIECGGIRLETFVISHGAAHKLNTGGTDASRS